MSFTGARTEGGDETLLDPADSSKQPDTPGEGNRTLRTRRQLKQKIFSDSEVEQSPQLNESKRPMRKGRGKKTNETADDSIVNVTIMSARKRTRKAQDITLITPKPSIDQEPVSAKKTRGRKKIGQKKTDKDTDNAENLINGQNIMDNDASIQSIADKTNLDNHDEMSSEDFEVAAASRRGNRKATVTPTNPRFHLLRSRGVNSPGSIVTPESSPLIVHLTPHRTTKTPRKSPIDLGSPKTHSTSPQRHSKTPRKLPIVSESPVPSENGSTDGTPRKIADKKSSATVSPSILSTNRRSSKSPSIIITRPSKAQSPRVNAKKVKKTPKKSPRLTAKSPRVQPSKIRTPQTPKTEKIETTIKSPQLILRRVSSPKCPTEADADIITPILSPSVLKKLNDVQASPKRQKSTGKKRSPVTSSGTPLRPIPTPTRDNSLNKSEIISSNNTPLALLALKNKVAITSSTPRERIRRSLNLSPSLEKSVNLQETAGLPNSPVSVSRFYGRSPKTSTRIHDDSNTFRLDDVTNPLISEDESFDMSGVKAVEISQDGEEQFAGNDKTIKTPEKEDDKANGTYELEEPKTPGLRKNKKIGDDTYELDEPKTPGLNKKKRSINETNINATVNAGEPIAKRVQRVRFASPPLRASVSRITMRQPAQRAATPASKNTSTNTSGTVQNKNTKTQKTMEINKPKRRRSNSLTNLREKTPTTEIKKRSLSVVDTSVRSAQKTLQNQSVNRLSKPRQSLLSEKKSEIKPMSAKKVPNFAQIHQKKFAQLESLVDGKKRVRERHNILTNNIVSSNLPKTLNGPSTSAVKVAPKEATNGVFNRFGFKVGKNEEKKIMAIKPATDMQTNRFGFKIRKDEAAKIINKQPVGKKMYVLLIIIIVYELYSFVCNNKNFNDILN